MSLGKPINPVNFGNDETGKYQYLSEIIKISFPYYPNRFNFGEIINKSPLLTEKQKATADFEWRLLSEMLNDNTFLKRDLDNYYIFTLVDAQKQSSKPFHFEDKSPKPNFFEKTMTDIAIEQRRRELELFGDIKTQPLLEKRFPADTPISQANNTPSNQTPMNRIMLLVNIIFKHPLWAAIIAGIVVILFSHFVFHVP